MRESDSSYSTLWLEAPGSRRSPRTDFASAAFVPGTPFQVTGTTLICELLAYADACRIRGCDDGFLVGESETSASSRHTVRIRFHRTPGLTAAQSKSLRAIASFE